MKIKTFAIMALAVCVIAALASPVLADSMISTVSEPQPGAPIQFKCVVGFEDSSIAKFYVGTDFAFRIEGDQTATAVEFVFDFYDAFGTRIGGTSAQKTGSFSPGVTIAPKIGTIPLFGGTEGVWEYKTVNAWPNLDSAKCHVDAIRWLDGSVWRPGGSSNGDTTRWSNSDTTQSFDTENSTCSELWLKRSTQSSHAAWRLIGDACVQSAEQEDQRSWLVVASRDHARAFVAYVHAGVQGLADSQHTLALKDLRASGSSHGSALFTLITSQLLAIDGAAKGSALDYATPTP